MSKPLKAKNDPGDASGNIWVYDREEGWEYWEPSVAEVVEWLNERTGWWWNPIEEELEVSDE